MKLSNKDIEKLGMKYLVSYIENEFSARSVKWWPSNEVINYGCDAIITVDGKDYFIELKASTRNPYNDNIRMTPSTITKCIKNAVLNKLIIALVVGVDSNTKPEIHFIPFCNIKKQRFLLM